MNFHKVYGKRRTRKTLLSATCLKVMGEPSEGDCELSQASRSVCKNFILDSLEIVSWPYASVLLPAEDGEELSRAYKQLLGRYYHSCFTGMK